MHFYGEYSDPIKNSMETSVIFKIFKGRKNDIGVAFGTFNMAYRRPQRNALS